MQIVTAHFIWKTFQINPIELNVYDQTTILILVVRDWRVIEQSY